jgi:hypothetical protein
MPFVAHFAAQFAHQQVAEEIGTRALGEST